MPLKYIFSCFFLLFIGHVSCQETPLPFSIRAVIVDSLNKQAIPFATVYKLRDRQGTLSDFQGAFTLEHVSQGDTIVFKTIGYDRTLMIADINQKIDTIVMNRTSRLLSEVTVVANDAFLYNLITNTTKKNNYQKSKAKTYFELETFHDAHQLELFQAYYNGTFQGYDVSLLELKNARFALAPINKRIFASTETSKALYMHSLMHSNDFFPASPFELNTKQLRKNYSLTLASKYKDENQKTIYVVNFFPKKHKDEFFQGCVWIDSSASSVLKVSFNINNATKYPFQPFWPTDSLTNVSFEITKTYNLRAGEIQLKSIDFNYSLLYKSSLDSCFNITTRAVLYAYDYEQLFELPYFHFSKTTNSDYRQIQIQAPNPGFWECIQTFKMTEQSNERKQFIEQEAIINTYNLFSSDTLFKCNIFENPFITWSGKRVLFRDMLIDTSRNDLEKTNIPSQLYHLEVQLYMDINEVCDSLQIITKTIFDPYLSYFKIEPTKESLAFINIYFDLIEMERRKLMDEIKICGNNLKLIQLKYKEALQRVEHLNATYFKQTERGTNKTNLKKWNDIVLKNLNIDNIRLFNIE